MLGIERAGSVQGTQTSLQLQPDLHLGFFDFTAHEHTNHGRRRVQCNQSCKNVCASHNPMMWSARLRSRTFSALWSIENAVAVLRVCPRRLRINPQCCGLKGLLFRAKGAGLPELMARRRILDNVRYSRVYSRAFNNYLHYFGEVPYYIYFI